MKNPAPIVAVVGLCGAGKSEVANYFVQQGFFYLRFGQITLDEIKRRGLAPTETNERQIREALRQEHGMAAFAKLNMPAIDEHQTQGKPVLIDGLYSWSEYKLLKEKYGQARDYAEIENIEKAGPIAMADYTILNTGTLQELENSLQKVHQNILENA